MFALCMCVCCRELRAQKRKSGVLLLRASIVYQKTSKKRKKKGKKRENFSPTKTREEEKTRGLVFVKSLDWKKILSFFLSSGRKPLRETTKEKKTHLNARRIKRREERERDGKRERRFIGRRRKPKRDGFGQTRRHSKAFAGGARGERDRDRGETRWVAVFETFRSFVFFSRARRGGASHPRRAVRSFSFGFVFDAEDKSFHSHPFFFSFRLATTEKTARIKQAKDEAEAEIQLYRNQREQRYQQMVAQATGGSDEMTKELEMKAKHAEANMRATIQKKEASVTGMLVKHVTSVQL